MASSSSSSHSVPASISESWNYDVFLSFRGEDTRKSFVDHLYMALEQQGIYTYKDDKTLARGESIGPTLLKAIQESRIAVVVFSENYADSSWCLAELAHIIECMDTRGQIVMPIFYQVDPSDVRKLKLKYEEAFTKHEKENKHTVESWRKALEKAGSISGWTINDTINSYEAKCIKEIVDTISNRLPTLSTNVNKNLIGIETRLQDLKSKLEIGSDDVRIFGIWGVGGGGKTTLASAAYAEMSHQFEAHCLFQNIREETKQHGLKKLQENFLSVVLKVDVKVGSEIEGRSMIERRLRRKCVLLVLDDVDNIKQLEALAGSHDWFGKGSRIIITTRDGHLLTRHADKVYEVSLLSHDEAMELFRRHAYRNDKPVEDYEMLSEEVVSYAGGLPLALEILGSFLYDKDKDEWKSALAKLKCIPNVEVTERLKISYDGLEPDQQKIFLDIACCFRGHDKDKAMMVLDACNLHPGIGIKVLVQKSLIKVVDGKFDMHDLIEEMAHGIVRGEHPKNLEKHSRIWKEEDIAYLCDTRADAPPTETEVLALRATTSHDPGLSDVVANMKKLRWIHFNKYPASLFPLNFQPTELGYLELKWSQQKELWEGCKHLPNLKILDLFGSKDLIMTPDFEGLPCLERLILEGCESLEEIHQSIGYHKRLVYVNPTWCTKLKMFPPIISMKRLETLIFAACFQLQQFPDIQSNMDSLVTLDLRWSGIEIIPQSVRFCTNLVSFKLYGCQKLKRIEGNLHLLKYLKDLDFGGSESAWLQNLITTPNFEGLPCLERLILDNCRSLEEIHPSIGYHKRLVYVNLTWCTALKRFPPIIHMKKLETLLLIGCCQLQQFLDIQSNMDSLVTLDLRWTGIEIIPPSLGLFCTNLVYFYLHGCQKLKRIESNLHLLKSLKDLDFGGCDSAGLQFLHQDRLVGLKLFQFPRSLRKLDLSYGNLGDGDIPSDICELLNLQLLNLRGNNFSRLHSSISRLPCLKYLDLLDCQSLVELPDLPSSIAILKAEGCESLESIGDLSYYKWLWKVSFGGCYKLIGGARVLHSMLQENVVKDRFMSVVSPDVEPSEPSRIFTRLVTFQLPHNWCSDFSGFLLFLREDNCNYAKLSIVIKQEISADHSEEFDKDWAQYDYERVGYVPFSSLRHIPWFNPTYEENISFQTDYGGLNIELVPCKIKRGDLSEPPIDYSECWDEEYEDRKTFKITYDSNSSEIQISWDHSIVLDFPNVSVAERKKMEQERERKEP
ncbi:putative TIR domain, P-loop containing nucleoside triphosphate hydrolase [Helianthus annuus]|nr:putative TIR domain, P-loop containing nucleoside triphosphate hydrolase [Helianthus annuus]